jgi:hypothetical protein
MSEAFSFNREYDFVRLDGLYRATGRSAHEWDLYIVKELIDNALDADELLWCHDPQQFPALSISMEYISVPPPHCQQLLVRVGNCARFPVKQIQDIFATQWYTSRNAFIKRLTRGALGNALKTLLGIPYALHNRVADDWKPDLKPLSICCNGTEYLPRYIVDPTAQTIRLVCETRPYKTVAGTVISVGLDYFVQEIPRTLAELEMLAQQYHLCNPHARFLWTVEIGSQVWKGEYEANRVWESKFSGTAPVQWYSLTAFKDLLGALYREQFGEENGCLLPLKLVGGYFAGFDSETTGLGDTQVATVTEVLGQDGLTEANINGPVATELYKALGKYSQRFDPAQLGCIGMEHVHATLSNTFAVEGSVEYKCVTEVGSDPSTPFVIEAAVARLKESKRQVWTAINFSPTYGDPFLSRWLHTPAQPNEPVLGLRGLLDAYNLREDTPFVLFLHLICPNVEHTEFSKTEVNHLPFEKALVSALDELLAEMKQTQDEEELRLEQSIFQALNGILQEVGANERFIFEQLIEKLRRRLSQDQALAAWLDRPDMMNRLRIYVESYQHINPMITRYVARPAEGMLNIPSHPEHYFTVLTEHISHDLLVKHHVNKILYVQPRELEPVVIENGWLCQMDMALLRNPPGPGGLEDALVQCASRSELPVLVLHNADEAGGAMVEQMRSWLRKRQLDDERIIDLGLSTATRAASQPARLVEMMPDELAAWLVERFKLLRISLKSMPIDTDIRRDISEQFAELLQEYLLERLGQKFAVASLMIDLDRQLSYTQLMMAGALDERLKSRLGQECRRESYTTVLEQVLKEFFEQYMDRYGVEVRRLEQAWLMQRQGR